MAVLLGALVGFIGALVGAGGGFLLMPVLLTVYGLLPARAAGVSLVMVTVSTLSSTLVYARQGRIDYRAGLMLALFAVPGSVAGALLAGRMPVGAFSWGFGLLLACAGGWMTLGVSPPATWFDHTSGRAPAALHLGFTMVGGLASLFGIGGGPLMVPLLSLWGRIPVHAAAATSQFVILISSLAGVVGYVTGGAVDWRLAAALSAGALLGAPVGALLSPHLPARRILQLIGTCLVLIGGRLAVK